MALRTLLPASMVAVLALVTEVAAHAPAPLVPTALVEDVQSATATVEFMDYVGRGQVIMLGPGDVLVLSYLKSCEHETITGGTVSVGAERSNVRDGKVVRDKIVCQGGKMQLTSAQASQSAASAFRLQSADIRSTPKVYARAPMVRLPKALAAEDRTLLIERADRRGERHTVKLDEASVAAGFYDLAKGNVTLARGATYTASIGGHDVTFQVDAKAKAGPAPIVSRLVRFQ